MGYDGGALLSSLGASAVGPVVKFTAAFPLVYHYLASVRHTLWDLKPELVQNNKVEQSSYILFAASGALSIAAAVV